MRVMNQTQGPVQVDVSYHSVLQKVLQTGGRGGAVTAVLLLHSLLHLPHLLLALFDVRKELHRDRK